MTAIAKSAREGLAGTLANPRDYRMDERDIASVDMTDYREAVRRIQAGIPPDTRSPTDVWPLLVWAYRGEQVRFSAGSDCGADTIREVSGTGWAMQVLEMGARVSGGGGTWHAPACHVDALIVHALVTQLVGDDYWLVVRTAERGAPPIWEPEIAPLRFVPVRRGNGRPEFIRDRCNIAVACIVRSVGYSQADAESIRAAACASYGRWIGLLDLLRAQLSGPGMGLTRWRVEGIGASRQPWRSKGSSGILTAQQKT